MKTLRSSKFWFAFYTYAVMAILIYMPIVILVVFSFNDSTIMSLPWSGFTTKWYAKILERPDLLKSLWNSLWVALIVTAVSLVLGVLAANAMARYRYKGRMFFTGFISIPFVMPWLILGIALLIFFTRVGVQLSLFTVILAHISFDVPLVAVLVASRLHQFDPNLDAAARDLGCGPLEAFRLVTFPIIAPAIIAAGILAFNWSFDAFVITHFVIGHQITFPIWVWSALRFPKNLPIINAVSSIIIVVEMALIFLAEWIRRRGSGGEEDSILF